MEQVDLERYQLTGLLGSGADYEVRAAVDRETGGAVVLKRPVPQMISRRMHRTIETRTDQTLEVWAEVGHSIPRVCPILGYSARANHDAYFGDALGQEYRVVVSERAHGIPLAGDVRARILRVPTGLGQTLFSLYPICYLESETPFPVQQQLLEVEEGFYAAGYLLLDLGPQNVFFQPSSGQIAVIDPGALFPRDMGRPPAGRAPRDIHDFYLEMLKYYTTPQTPPVAADGYREPCGMRPVVNFAQELDELSRNLTAGTSDDAVKGAGLKVIAGVRCRRYADFGEFRRDLTLYLAALRERNQRLSCLAEAQRAWQEALNLLREDHWRKYLFDADTDLAELSRA